MHPIDLKRMDGIENIESVRRVANILSDRPVMNPQALISGTALALAFWGFVIIATFAWGQR